MYLLDASALIKAKNHYYQFERVPQFWEWLQLQAVLGNVGVPQKIYEEVTKQDDELKKWIAEIKEAIVVGSDNYDTMLPEVLARYSQGGVLSPADIHKMGADPHLVACALDAQSSDETVMVITGEVSQPKRMKGNRKIPDICDELGVKWSNIDGLKDRVGLIDLLDFKAR